MRDLAQSAKYATATSAILSNDGTLGRHEEVSAADDGVVFCLSDQRSPISKARLYDRCTTVPTESPMSDDLKERVLEIVSIAKECPENLQPLCFELLLRDYLEGRQRPRTDTG